MAHKVLIVSGEEAIFHAVGKALQGVASAIHAASGWEAFEKALSSRPDLILLDAGMPSLGGRTVCEQMKGSRHAKDIPLLLMSEERQSASGLKSEILGLESGALGFVLKPINPALVKAKVSSLLRHIPMPAGQPEPALAPLAASDDAAKPAPLPAAARSRMIIEDEDDELSWEGGAMFINLFKIMALISLLLIAGLGAYRLYIKSFAPAVKEQAPAEMTKEAPPSTDEPAAAAQDQAPGAGACDPIPEVPWWGTVRRDYIIRYVNGAHQGNWDEYAKKWEDHLREWSKSLAMNATVMARDGTLLEGEALKNYLEQLRKRIDIIHCLARKAQASAPAKP